MMKKIFAAIVAGTFLFTVAPTIVTTNVAYAAKGGAKIAPKASAPKAAPAAPKSNVTEKKAGPNQNEYAPSKSAKDLNKEAPKSNSAAPANNAASTPNTSSGMGSMMRNVGLFAGGMLLGGLLANAFGMGGMGEIFGMLANVIFIVLAILVLRWLWYKFKGRKSENQNPYNMNSYNANTYNQNNVEIPPINPPSSNNGDYNPKTTADRYRNR